MKFISKSSPAPHQTAFTLVELLVAIVILGILILAGAGIFGGTEAQTRKTSVDTLAGLLEQARTTAISSHSHIVLALAEPGALPGGDERCRTGLFKVSDWPAESTTSATLNGTLLGRWTPLSKGLLLIGGSEDGISNPIDEEKITIRYGSSNRPREVRARAIAFHPRGGLQYPAGSGPVTLRIAEGHYRNGLPSPKLRDGKIAESHIKVGRVTGRPYRTN